MSEYSQRVNNVSPEDVLDLSSPSENFLCGTSSNIYGIEFLSFVIQDFETRKVWFEVSREMPVVHYFGVNDLDRHRKMYYTLPESFLRIPKISTSLVFKVNQALENFRMIERHYFRQQLIKSFDFSFGHTLAHSTNTWELIYDVPPLDNNVLDAMCTHPYETTSDSYYFVGDSLVMHNKAYYGLFLNSPSEDDSDEEDDVCAPVIPTLQ